MSKVNLRTFTIGRFFIGLAWASRNSMWITRTNKNRSRMDHIFSIHRSWNRNERKYIYGIIAYKLNIKLIIRSK